PAGRTPLALPPAPFEQGFTMGPRAVPSSGIGGPRTFTPQRGEFVGPAQESPITPPPSQTAPQAIGRPMAAPDYIQLMRQKGRSSIADMLLSQDMRNIAKQALLRQYAETLRQMGIDIPEQ